MKYLLTIALLLGCGVAWGLPEGNRCVDGFYYDSKADACLENTAINVDEPSEIPEDCMILNANGDKCTQRKQEWCIKKCNNNVKQKSILCDNCPDMESKRQYFIDKCDTYLKMADEIELKKTMAYFPADLERYAKIAEAFCYRASLEKE